MDKEKSTFIKVDNFNAVVAALGVVKKKLSDAKTTLDKINALKQEEDSAAQRWAAELESIGAKVDNIEQELMKE